MGVQIDHKLRSLIQTLRTKGFVLKGIPNGFRIKLEHGPDVDIYTLKSNPAHVRARIKTQVNDAGRRGHLVDEVQREIATSLHTVADLKSFRLTKDMEGVFVYYAHLDLNRSEASTGEEAAEEEAGEVEVQVLEDPVVQDGGDPAPDSSVDEPVFEVQDGLKTFEGEIEFPGFEDEQSLFSLAKEAVSELESVDAKVLRQAMDTLCLARSSNVRMVLTRLYRSAIDAEELAAAVKLEASKIYSSEEMGELKIIRDLRSVEFLSPLIELLWQEVVAGKGRP